MKAHRLFGGKSFLVPGLHLILPMLVVIGVLYTPNTAMAFKVKTHVWVGQQVLNDLDDSRVTIPINGVPYTYPVKPEIVTALLNNPGMYRMGNIGPDALPDILTGQFVVHPGNPKKLYEPDDESKWQTDHWLKWLLSGADSNPQNLAFAYGYLGHAAADVFAHTYVNEYSGDIFLLSDGEIEVETRHVALESYIEQRTPKLTDAQGNYLGEAKDLLAVPAVFLRDRLILNDTVAEQYLDGIKAPHLAAVQKLKNQLQSAYGPLDQVDNWILDLITGYQGEIALNRQEIETLLRLAQDINNAINSNVIEEIQNAKNAFVDHIVNTYGMSQELQNQFDEAVVKILEVSSSLDALLLELAAKHDELANTVKEFCTTTCEEVCSISCVPQPWPLKDICENTCNDVCTTTCELNPAYVSLEEIISQLLGQKAAIEQELLKAYDALRATRNVATAIVIETIQAENDIFNGLIDTAQRMTSDLNIIRAEINSWIKDINDGMAAYIIANREVIKESMKLGEDGDMLAPLSNWWDCWGLAVTGGIPAPINHTLCSISNRIDNVTAAVDDFEEKMVELNPVINAWYELKEKLLEQAKEIAKDAAYDFVEKITGVDFKQIVKLFTEKVDAARLNNIFSEDGSNKGLLLIDDIADRVDAEMYLANPGADSRFDPQRYAVAYNAVILAKLALLDAEQLDMLAQDAGVVSPTLYGNTLYMTGMNIMFDSLRSIDGNHQWMEVAPPYPRRRGFTDAGWPDDRQYGYSFDGVKGFRIWQDEQARDNVFRSIFIGPLVPGVEIPRSMGFTAVLPPDYPYMVCESNPFPDDIYDRSCIFNRVPAGVTLPARAIRALQRIRGRGLGF